MASGIDNYRSGIRAAFRGLWLDVLSYDQFFDTLTITITNGLTRAWNEGAADCGMTPEDRTAEEQKELMQAIYNEYSFIDRMATDIEAHNRAQGGKLEPLLARGDLWAMRYQDVANRARALACGDQKLEWVLGMTKKHCETCLRLAGVIKRASQWEATGLHPQMPPNERLECGGWRCLCTFRVTKLKASPGPMPHGFRG